MTAVSRGRDLLLIRPDQILLPCQKYSNRKQHPNASRSEPIMPGVLFTERPNNQRRRDHTRVDAEIENLERIGPAQIVRLIKRADLAGDVAFEQPATGDKTKQGEQE